MDSIDTILLPRERMGSFKDLLVDADEVWVAGRSLPTFMRNYAVFIQEAAQKGKRFKLLMVNPDHHSTMVALTYSGTENDVASLELAAHEALSLMKQIRSKVPQNTIEIKLADFVPQNLFRIVDPDKETGRMVIEHFDYKVPVGQRRNFAINKNRDPETFSFYLTQFEKMWNDGIYV